MVEEIPGDGFIEGISELGNIVGRTNPLTLAEGLATAKRYNSGI
jgi:hypothetical protein